MVARRKRAVEKTLIRQDGTQMTAQVGMVDKCGVMFNVLDVGTTYLEFQPISEIAKERELENEQLRYELADANETLKCAVDYLEKASNLIDELLLNGQFEHGEKGPFHTRQWKIKKTLDEMRAYVI